MALRRLSGMILAMMLFAVPAAGEQLMPDALFGFIKDVMAVVSRPDPYLWIYECPENASVDDIPACAQTLRDLGLQEVTERIEANCYAWNQEMQTVMTQHGMEYDVSRERLMLWLLYDAGFYKQPEIEQRSIYAFDAEVLDVDSMYRGFLEGIESISSGELSFDNIVEDLSGVDWENGEGMRTITFDLNGKNHVYTAKAQQDWFDMDMLNALCDAVGTSESGKQLHFVLDGGQGCILFYQTQEWAQQFTKATGCPLFTGL